MPNLPTLTVTQAQLDTLTTVFGTQQAYLDWLKKQLIWMVHQYQATNAADIPSSAV